MENLRKELTDLFMKYITQFRKANLLNHEHNKYTKTNNSKEEIWET